MKYLLDTNVALWFFNGDDKFSTNTLACIDNQANAKFISIASAWEIAIKICKGTLRFDGGVSCFFDAVSAYGFSILPVNEQYVKIIETLPLHHRDPFDRIIIATAIAENMAIISSDDVFRKYAVKLVL